jgi:hypothetical protein
MDTKYEQSVLEYEEHREEIVEEMQQRLEFLMMCINAAQQQEIAVDPTLFPALDSEEL